MKYYFLIPVFAAVLHFGAISQTILTEVSPSLSLCSSTTCDTNFYDIDFNNDGTSDLKLWFDVYKTGAGCVSTQTVYLFSVQPIDTAELLMNASGDLVYLNNEDTVKETSDAVFNDYFCENDDIYNCPFLISATHYDCETTPSETTGNYGPFENKYIGLKLKILNDYHYCWINVSKTEGVNLELHSYAYNETPNEELIINDPNVNSLEKSLLDKVKCYPNPVSDYLSIQLEIDKYTVEVTDVYSNIIHKATYSGTNISIPTSSWSQGVYFVRIITTNGRVTKKIVKR